MQILRSVSIAAEVTKAEVLLSQAWKVKLVSAAFLVLRDSSSSHFRRVAASVNSRGNFGAIYTQSVIQTTTRPQLINTKRTHVPLVVSLFCGETRPSIGKPPPGRFPLRKNNRLYICKIRQIATSIARPTLTNSQWWDDLTSAEEYSDSLDQWRSLSAADIRDVCLQEDSHLGNFSYAVSKSALTTASSRLRPLNGLPQIPRRV